MKGLCKYSDIFGKPDTGLHSYRLFDFAVVDIVLTVLAAYLIFKLFKLKGGWNFTFILTILIVLGIILHRLFCVNTKLNTMIFGEIKK